MGEARDIVGQPGDEVSKPRKPRSRKTKEQDVIAKASVIEHLTEVIDDLDRAIQVKQDDVHTEGKALAPENHYKLGILKGADSLIRRARAMLQDYGVDLDLALNPTLDTEAANGEEIEAHGDMAHFTTDGTCPECGKQAKLCEDCGQCPDCCFCKEAEAEKDDPDADKEDPKAGGN